MAVTSSPALTFTDVLDREFRVAPHDVVAPRVAGSMLRFELEARDSTAAAARAAEIAGAAFISTQAADSAAELEHSARGWLLETDHVPWLALITLVGRAELGEDPATRSRLCVLDPEDPLLFCMYDDRGAFAAAPSPRRLKQLALRGDLVERRGF